MMTKGLDHYPRDASPWPSGPGGCGLLSQLVAQYTSGGKAAAGQLFDHLFNLMGEPIVAISSDGSLLAANRSWYELAARLRPGGALAKGYLGLVCAAATAPDTPEETGSLEMSLQVIFRGEAEEIRHELTFTLEGQRCSYEMQACAIVGLGDPVALVIHRDISSRRKLEIEHREGHNLFQQLISNISNAVFLYDTEGRFVMANASAAEAFGLSMREMIGRSIFDVYKPEMAQTVQEQNLLVLTTGQTLSFELMLETPRGLRNFHVSKSVYRNSRQEPVGILGVARDITDGRQVIEALEKSERHFRALIENGGDRVGLLDGSGMIIYASPSTKRILGYDIDELIGTDAFLWVHPQDRPSARQRLKELLEYSERIVTAQYRVLHKSGVWKWMEASATNHLHDPAIRAVVLNERDITERKVAEAELVGYSQLIESSNDAIIGTDLQGHITSWNPAAARIFGYSEKEVIGLPASTLVTPGNRRQHQQLRQGTLRGEGVTDYELQMLHKSGRRISVSLSIAPLRNESRVIAGCAKIIRDITERHRLEREILEISDREKQRLGQDLHDDLCQHLVGISLISNMLAEQLEKQSLPQSSEARNIADLARHAVDHARSLARGLTPLRLEEEGLISQIALLVSVTERLFRVPCTFESDLELQVRHLTTATHFYRIVQEALHNAVKHSQATQVCVKLVADGNNIVLSVEDNGVGIGNAETDSEFGEGSGLGMHTMQYRARFIHANLEFRENPGGGTVVACSIPRRKLGC